MKFSDSSPYLLGGALLIIALYFLSPPFLIKALGMPFLEAHTREFEIIYAPAIWLADNFPPYQNYIQFTGRLLGLAP